MGNPSPSPLRCLRLTQLLAAGVVCFTLLGCKGPPPQVAPPAANDDDGVDDDDDDDTSADDDDATVDPGDDLTGLEALACYGGETGCADEGPYLDGTCCTFGDNLERVGGAAGSEVVDLEYNGDWVVTCGGFGARASRSPFPGPAKAAASFSSRCQRIAFGATEADGDQVVYLAHHGDGWVATPFLGTWLIGPAGEVQQLDVINDASVLFEGLHWQDGMLYVAAHGGGLRIYETGDDHVPSLVSVVGGFDNALKLDVRGDHAFVSDETGVKVVDVSDPANAAVVHSVNTSGKPRDIDVLGDRLYVAMGSRGLDVFDTSDPLALVNLGNVELDGSLQAVSAHMDKVAVAAWSHVALLDAARLEVIATERVTPFPNFEQNLGVALVEDVLLVGEWEGGHVFQFREGYVAPDVWVSEEALSFTGDEAGQRTLHLSNRGPLDLSIDAITVTDDDHFAVEPTELTILAGEETTLTVDYTPPSPGPASNFLLMASNDPDPNQAVYRVPLFAAQGGGIDVGDPIDESFAFLDPTGQEDLANLEGHVIVLAYFALF